MQFTKQVEASHYDFMRYMHPRRWQSIRQQVAEVSSFSPKSVLEIGPGPGVFKAIVETLGVKVETVDVDPELRPTHVASATHLPVSDNAYDVVCAFQVLEHLPYDESLIALQEMVRVAKRAVIVSIPNSRKRFRYIIQIPKVGDIVVLLRVPRLRAVSHIFDGEHHWELEKAGFPLNRIKRDFCSAADLPLLREYVFNGNPYHHFFVFEKSAT